MSIIFAQIAQNIFQGRNIYTKRGFKLLNKMQLFEFFLWLLGNNLIRYNDCEILQILTEGCYQLYIKRAATNNDRLSYCLP